MAQEKDGQFAEYLRTTFGLCTIENDCTGNAIVTRAKRLYITGEREKKNQR
jgi:hypothetical protein